MKLLNGAEIASYIKQRHAVQVRALLSQNIIPTLAVVQVKNDPIINTYVRLKRSYGADIGVRVDVLHPTQAELPATLSQLSSDSSVHGIIVQLPLPDPATTEQTLNLVHPNKDVDALGSASFFEPATPMAILWLLNGYNVELKKKRLLLIGRGKLVGAPLEKMLRSSGYDVDVVERENTDLARHTLAADIIITATGSPAILYSDMIKKGAVVVDAGIASEHGKTVGDLAPEVYQRQDLTLTPQKGGVGPLTVCALFENVIRAAQNANR